MGLVRLTTPTPALRSLIRTTSVSPSGVPLRAFSASSSIMAEGDTGAPRTREGGYVIYLFYLFLFFLLFFFFSDGNHTNSIILT